MVRDSVEYLRGLGREVMIDVEHFFDGYRFDAEYTTSVVVESFASGATCVILCDTNGGSLPHDVFEIVHSLRASLEAAGLARRGFVVAVEAKPERVALIRENRAGFHALNLEVVTARLPDALPVAPEAAGPADLPLALGPAGPLLPRPKRIFIGGGLGASEGADSAAEILVRAWGCLLPGGRMVVSCVLLGTFERVRRFFDDRGIAYGIELVHAQRGAPLAGDLRLVPDNPVFLLHAGKEGRG